MNSPVVFLSLSQTRIYNEGSAEQYQPIAQEINRQARELANQTSTRVEIRTHDDTLIGFAEPRFTGDSRQPNAYRPSTHEVERSALQGDQIARFRAEY